MEKIKEFINQFIIIEKKAEEALLRNDIKTHNSLVENILELSIPDLELASKIGFPIPPSIERMIERNKNTPVNKRHLYKISEYTYPRYDKIWACYTSIANPIAGPIKLMSNLFMLAHIEDKLKIITQFRIDPNNSKWRCVGGDKDINIYYLSNPIAIERLLSPENDEWSINEYDKEA